MKFVVRLPIASSSMPCERISPCCTLLNGLTGSGTLTLVWVIWKIDAVRKLFEPLGWNLRPPSICSPSVGSYGRL